mgnify:CR=1 FL=1
MVEDLFLAHGDLDDGAWVSFEVSKYTRSRACWLEAVGEEGQLWVDYLEGAIVLRCGRDELRDFFEVDARYVTLAALGGAAICFAIAWAAAGTIETQTRQDIRTALIEGGHDWDAVDTDGLRVEITGTAPDAITT